MEDNQLLDSQGAGLFLDDASASLAGNSYADNTVDLVVQGSGCDTPPQGYEEEILGSSELCPIYDYATCGDEFSLYLDLAEPGSGEGVAALRSLPPGPAALHIPEARPLPGLPCPQLKPGSLLPPGASARPPIPANLRLSQPTGL